jgi:hypothetical protein
VKYEKKQVTPVLLIGLVAGDNFFLFGVLGALHWCFVWEYWLTCLFGYWRFCVKNVLGTSCFLFALFFIPTY